MTTPTLNVKTAADMLQVHPNTVEKLIAQCQLPAARVGRAYVILTKDVLTYIENQVARQTADRMRGGQPSNAMGSAMGKRGRVSPQRARQIRAPKVGISTQHGQAAVAGNLADLQV